MAEIDQCDFLEEKGLLKLLNYCSIYNIHLNISTISKIIESYDVYHLFKFFKRNKQPINSTVQKCFIIKNKTLLKNFLDFCSSTKTFIETDIFERILKKCPEIKKELLDYFLETDFIINNNSLTIMLKDDPKFIKHVIKYHLIKNIDINEDLFFSILSKDNEVIDYILEYYKIKNIPLSFDLLSKEIEYNPQNIGKITDFYKKISFDIPYSLILKMIKYPEHLEHVLRYYIDTNRDVPEEVIKKSISNNIKSIETILKVSSEILTLELQIFCIRLNYRSIDYIKSLYEIIPDNLLEEVKKSSAKELDDILFSLKPHNENLNVKNLNDENLDDKNLDIKNLNYEQLVKLIKENPNFIKDIYENIKNFPENIENINLSLKLISVQNHPNIIKFIIKKYFENKKIIPYELQQNAVIYYPESIKYLFKYYEKNELPFDLLSKCIDNDPHSIRFLYEFMYEVPYILERNAIIKNPFSIKHMRNPHKELIIEALKRDYNTCAVIKIDYIDEYVIENLDIKINESEIIYKNLIELRRIENFKKLYNNKKSNILNSDVKKKSLN